MNIMDIVRDETPARMAANFPDVNEVSRGRGITYKRLIFLFFAESIPIVRCENLLWRLFRHSYSGRECLDRYDERAAYKTINHNMNILTRFD